jgi:hypothetical protein
MGLGFSAALLLGASAHGAREQETAGAEPVLEIMSPDRGDCTLRLSWLWGAMAVNHVLLDDHRGPFKAIVEPTGRGVRVTFNGWGEEPFVASADKQIRIVYRVGRKKEIDFTAEVASTGEVRVRPEGRKIVEGKRVVIGLGKEALQISAAGTAK